MNWSNAGSEIGAWKRQNIAPMRMMKIKRNHRAASGGSDHAETGTAPSVIRSMATATSRPGFAFRERIRDIKLLSMPTSSASVLCVFPAVDKYCASFSMPLLLHDVQQKATDYVA